MGNAWIFSRTFLRGGKKSCQTHAAKNVLMHKMLWICLLKKLIWISFLAKDKMVKRRQNILKTDDQIWYFRGFLEMPLFPIVNTINLNAVQFFPNFRLV